MPVFFDPYGMQVGPGPVVLDCLFHRPPVSGVVVTPANQEQQKLTKLGGFEVRREVEEA